VQLPESEKRLIARAVESHLLGQSEQLPILVIELCEEASSWVRRILQLIGRSKSARPVCEQSVDGVVVDRMQSENVVQAGPQLEALEGWKHLDLSALLEQVGLCASQVATAQLLVTSRLINPSSDSCVLGGCRRDSAAGA
jgi:hypothetical protein